MWPVHQEPAKTALLRGFFHSRFDTYGRSTLSSSSVELYQNHADGKRRLPGWLHFTRHLQTTSSEWLLTEWNRTQCWGGLQPPLTLMGVPRWIAIVCSGWKGELHVLPVWFRRQHFLCLPLRRKSWKNVGTYALYFCLCVCLLFPRKQVVQILFCLEVCIHAAVTFMFPQEYSVQLEQGHSWVLCPCHHTMHEGWRQTHTRSTDVSILSCMHCHRLCSRSKSQVSLGMFSVPGNHFAFEKYYFQETTVLFFFNGIVLEGSRRMIQGLGLLSTCSNH